MPSFEDLVVARRQHVRQAAAEQAAQPSAPEPAHPLLMPLALVVVDEQPISSDGSYYDQWGTLPAPFRATLDVLIAAYPAAAKCWQCGSTAVGWATAEDERSWVWQLTGLLWSPMMADDPVNVLCEGCTPLVLDRPAPDVPL